jgi:hypothetical protein
MAGKTWKIEGKICMYQWNNLRYYYEKMSRSTLLKICILVQSIIKYSSEIWTREGLDGDKRRMETVELRKLSSCIQK